MLGCGYFLDSCCNSAAIQMINEYFGVVVVSEPRMASARIETGCLVEGRTAAARCGMRITCSLLLILALLAYAKHGVLRGSCLSVDEPIQGSTPALRHPWLAYHSYPEVLLDHLYCWHSCSTHHKKQDQEPTATASRIFCRPNCSFLRRAPD